MILWLGCGAEAAAIGLSSILIYVLIYTPMKPLTPWCTLVGAVPGALPPMIGWSAAMHGAELPLATNLFGGLSLFLLMLVWQMPHFWAIAWMYRDDYAAGGFKVLPVVDPDGSRTARSMRFWSLLLLPVSLLPWWAMPELIGPVYVVAAIAIGVLFARLCLQLAEDRSRDRARRVFFLSIIQLPLLLIALVADAFATVLLR
ncbi:MAG: protoheme IX farnesyltransferase [Planctomycetota bacterium]